MMEYRIARAVHDDGTVVFGFTAGKLGGQHLWVRKTTDPAGTVCYWIDVALPSAGLVLYIHGATNETLTFCADETQKWRDKVGYSIEMNEQVRANLLTATSLGIMICPLPKDEATVNRLALVANGHSLVNFQTALRLLMVC